MFGSVRRSYLSQSECDKAAEICQQINVRCEIIQQDLAETRAAIERSIEETNAFIAKLEAAQRKVSP